MSSARSTRSQKTSLLFTQPISTPSKPPKPRPTAKSSLSAKVNYLCDQYHDLYDKGDAFKTDLLEAKGKTELANRSSAFASCMVSECRPPLSTFLTSHIQNAFVALVTEMESTSVENWELARPNITPWAHDLTGVAPTRELLAARDQIYDLGRRIDVLTRPPVLDDPATPEEEGSGADEQEDVEEEAEAEPALIENETIVSGYLT
jgi:hypothetical protein